MGEARHQQTLGPLQDPDIQPPGRASPATQRGAADPKAAEP